FIVGAMKSGTTTLHETLGRHPEIFMSPYKEPGFFSGQWFPHDSWFDSHPGPDPEGQWYHVLFEEPRRNPRARYAGESSANYTSRYVWERCAERIRAFNPEARILYIIRDPVERSIAHYNHNSFFELEHRSMIEAARSDPSLTDVSNYAMQLKPYFDAFPPE